MSVNPSTTTISPDNPHATSQSHPIRGNFPSLRPPPGKPQPKRSPLLRSLVNNARSVPSVSQGFHPVAKALSQTINILKHYWPEPSTLCVVTEYVVSVTEGWKIRSRSSIRQSPILENICIVKHIMFPERFCVSFAFRDTFMVAPRTPHLDLFCQQLPDVFIGTLSDLEPLVHDACALVASSFAASDMALPSWRTYDHIMQVYNDLFSNRGVVNFKDTHSFQKFYIALNSTSPTFSNTPRLPLLPEKTNAPPVVSDVLIDQLSDFLSSPSSSFLRMALEGVIKGQSTDNNPVPTSQAHSHSHLPHIPTGPNLIPFPPRTAKDWSSQQRARLGRPQLLRHDSTMWDLMDIRFEKEKNKDLETNEVDHSKQSLLSIQLSARKS